MSGEQSQEQQGTKTATGVKTSSKLMEEEWEQWVCVAGVCVSEWGAWVAYISDPH